MDISLLSISAICKLLSISRETLFREIASGRLIALKVGRRTLLRSVDLLKWIENNQYRRSIKCDPSISPEILQIISSRQAITGGRLAWTIAEFAHLTSLSTETIRREIKAGRIAGVRTQRLSTLIPAEAGYAWIKGLGMKKVGRVE